MPTCLLAAEQETVWFTLIWIWILAKHIFLCDPVSVLFNMLNLCLAQNICVHNYTLKRTWKGVRT